MAFYGKFRLKDGIETLESLRDMRSVLIVPAGPPDHATLDSGAAALLLRLGAPKEDAARRQARAQACAWVEAALQRTAPPRVFVQVAPVTSEILEADLDALAGAMPEGVFLEGCAGRAHVQQLSVKLAVREAAAGLGAGVTRIVALAAQAPAGVFALGGYRDASSRLAALALDETPLPGGAQAWLSVRGLLALGAAAAGCAALDFAPALEGDALSAFCRQARREGFSGMLTRDFAQIGGIEAAFSAP